ncbi:DEAD/DEAH box helicase [Fusobacterium periodonticum]|jgi:TRCF domain|uniref:Transcription-repair-coupling factor n=2 Tax=Fusobacterium periodonticum TaxID=860 RepID=A0AAD0HW70_9FUSO|nr:DEAD/DEAH box helicase [Fusobacterium periodonticum]AVQ26067.1 transcription-repair coupling factor [Fusobacterium periodonticum]KGE61518.1 transcription-repair coupling factor [Fusobacterium periodonticum 2_1_31]
MEKKFRGEIPFWLKNKKNSIVYVCSSNRNIDDYFFVLKDFYKGRILRIKKENENGELKKYNYDLLELLKSDEKFIILISLEYFLEDYYSKANSIFIEKGKEVDIKALEEKLIEAEFEKTYMLTQRKEYSIRGDILDIFNINQENPVRIEFFGNEVDRITYFDLHSQLSIEKLDSIELYIDNNKDKKDFFSLMYTNKNKVEYYYENNDILQAKVKRLMGENSDRENDIINKITELSKIGKQIEIQKFTEEELKQFEVIDRIKKLSENTNIVIYSEEATRYKEIFKGYDIKFEKYPLFEGYRTEDKLILTDREIKGIRVKRERVEKKALRYKTVDEIAEQDYVIHENFGVGIFLGLENIDGQDYLKIKYADEDKLYVPLDGINKIEKYINISDVIPEIYKLGRKGFKRKKARLSEDIEIFAKEIIKIQAKRNLANGFKFSKDTVMQEEFEEAFPFTETPGQLKAIEDVKRDMESGKVMDRLVCGDVGYGKTEVAIRAAFKAIMDEKQVVLLVPTTVLAEQHYERFSERFKNYPINIEILSRVQTKKEQEESIKKIENGSADLIIGTHRLLSDDIKYNDIGLLIIDEEQKFGVKAKEKLKKLKGDIDILTLTATPIPRTLNLSLLGIRDLSIIDTSPEGRQKIQTEYIDNNKDLIRDIIITEVSREGQVFYIFNSVKRIEMKSKELRELLPEYIKVDYIHGQMLARDIKRAIHNFENGNTDVLIATTIIENGIDIENANTMIIEGVEKLGLSQVYQLRGRIGRSNKKSYCYMLMNENKTKNAQKREESIREFDNLTGIDLSMEDSKIRGVGEILGEKQHGAVETFGYNLYMKMLNEEILKLKGENEEELEDVNIELNFPRFLPDNYIEKNEKIKIYKRALALKTFEELEDLHKELEDRFGRLKSEAKGFFEFLKIRIRARELGIVSIKEDKEKRILINFNEEKINVDKIIYLLANKKIMYSKFTRTIGFDGDIFEFFDLYSN